MSDFQNPFPGLRPFNSEESNLFFGRERHLKEIQRKLELHRFVSIVGNSGSGKSSLVKAGLIPTLTNHPYQWKICSFRPSNNPINELANALVKRKIVHSDSLTSDELVVDLENKLNKSRLGLIQVVRSYISPDQPLLIIVDQFEELFRFQTSVEQTLSVDFANHFVAVLLSAAEQKDLPIYILITLRSDFLGDCEQFMGLPEAINDGQFLIPRMNKEELQHSLTGPIQVANGKISPRLVQQLLNEVGTNQDQLPILQHVLMRTWEVWKKENQTGDPMDVPHYLEAGGMSKALSNHAEEAYSELTKDKQKKIVKTIFQTITTKGSDNRGVRRPTTIKKVAQIAEVSSKEIIKVISHFRQAGRGFVMPPMDVNVNENSVLDISHESLMRIWNRLKQWVDEEAESAMLYQRITENALLYEQDKAGLWRDPDLQIASDWIKEKQPNEHWASQYNDSYDLAMRFIEASKQEKHFMLKEKRRKRIFRNAAVFAVLIVLSGLSLWAIKERDTSLMYAQSAIDERNVADQHKKTAEENYKIAKQQEQIAQTQQQEAERQRKIALTSAKDAKLQKALAEEESRKAIDAKIAAERDRRISERQKEISDSLKTIAVASEQKAKHLRLLALSQNLAIKSKTTDASTDDRNLKALLALQAYQWNATYGGKTGDLEIYSALFSAMRAYQTPSQYSFNRHTDYVNAIAFNKKNQLASASNDGFVAISNSPLHTQVQKSKEQSLLLDNVYFNADGTKIALTTDENTIEVFDINDLNQDARILKGIHNKEIIALQWGGPDLLSASLDSTIKITNVVSGTVKRTIKLPSRPEAICHVYELGQVFVGGDDGVVYRIDLNEDNEPKAFINLKKGRITALTVNKNRTSFAVGTESGYCAMVHVNDPNCMDVIVGHTAWITQVSFHPNNQLLATSCNDGKVRLYNTTDLGMPPMVFSEHVSWVLDVDFSNDGSTLASCSRDQTIKTYPVSQIEIVEFLKSKCNRNLSKEEWSIYIGNDIVYSKTIPEIN